MRLSLARTVLLAVCTILTAISGRALAEGSADGASLQPKDWITLNDTATVDPRSDYGRSWSQHDQQPVLLPLPAESWTGIALLITVVGYCGVRRARFLAIR
jgi:hypothetical protein